MEWNVFYHDINRREIATFNIFKHGGFRKDVEEALKKCKTFEEFKETVRRSLQYYFWSRAEYEIIISPWCGGKDTSSKKLDIYTQVMNNWEQFIDYVWKEKR